MKNIYYRVNRDNICIGLLDKTDFSRIKIIDHAYDLSPFTKREIAAGLITEEEAIQELKNESVSPYSPLKSFMLEYTDSCTRMIEETMSRKGIIVCDENNCANDLLFDAPSYFIFNISPDEECLKADISYKWTFKFDRILQYFNYPKIMTYQDVLRMKAFFLDSDFIFEYCRLFGKELCDGSGWQMPDGRGGFKFFCNTTDFVNGAKTEIPAEYFLTLYDTRLFDYTPKEYERHVRSLELK